MGRQNTTVRINPDVLRWAMAGSGCGDEVLPDSTDASLKTVQISETHDIDVSVRDLKKISKSIKRPLSILLLSKPPVEKEMPDYRKVGGIDAVEMSKPTLDTIRHAKYAQFNARDMLEALSQDMKPDITFRTLEDDPEVVADIERKLLGFDTKERQKGELVDAFVNRVYLYLKERMESLNILVMQANLEIREV